jgi:hypothetical protein
MLGVHAHTTTPKGAVPKNGHLPCVIPCRAFEQLQAAAPCELSHDVGKEDRFSDCAQRCGSALTRRVVKLSAA